MSEENEKKTLVAISNGEVISRLERFLAPKIGIPPLWTMENVYYNCRMVQARQETYIGRRWKTVVALSIGYVISGLISSLAAQIYDSPLFFAEKIHNFWMVHDRRETCIKH
jgi:hypothetical protein